jgi:molecular chaperone GrpE
MKDDKKKEEKEKEEAVVSQGEFDAVQELASQFEEKYKRAIADYQNLQKRVSEEKKDWIISANKELLLRMLPVLDTLILANKHVQNDGLSVTIQQFLDVLKAEGVTKIKTEGEAFNPHTMECIATSEGEEDTVLEEIRAGYLINDKILRPAQVAVGKKK